MVIRHKQTHNDRNTRFLDTEVIKKQRLKIIRTVKIDSSHKGKKLEHKRTAQFHGHQDKGEAHSHRVSNKAGTEKLLTGDMKSREGFSTDTA